MGKLHWGSFYLFCVTWVFLNNILKLADHEVALQFLHFPCKAGFTGMEKFDKGSFYYLLWEFQVTVASLKTPETLDPIQNFLIEFIPSLENFPNESDFYKLEQIAMEPWFHLKYKLLEN